MRIAAREREGGTNAEMMVFGHSGTRLCDELMGCFMKTVLRNERRIFRRVGGVCQSGYQEGREEWANKIAHLEKAANRFEGDEAALVISRPCAVGTRPAEGREGWVGASLLNPRAYDKKTEATPSTVCETASSMVCSAVAVISL